MRQGLIALQIAGWVELVEPFGWRFAYACQPPIHAMANDPATRESLRRAVSKPRRVVGGDGDGGAGGAAAAGTAGEAGAGSGGGTAVASTAVNVNSGGGVGAATEAAAGGATEGGTTAAAAAAAVAGIGGIGGGGGGVSGGGAAAAAGAGGGGGEGGGGSEVIEAAGGGGEGAMALHGASDGVMGGEAEGEIERTAEASSNGVVGGGHASSKPLASSDAPQASPLMPTPSSAADDGLASADVHSLRRVPPGPRVAHTADVRLYPVAAARVDLRALVCRATNGPSPSRPQLPPCRFDRYSRFDWGRVGRGGGWRSATMLRAALASRGAGSSGRGEDGGGGAGGGAGGAAGGRARSTATAGSGRPCNKGGGVATAPADEATTATMRQPAPWHPAPLVPTISESSTVMTRGLREAMQGAPPRSAAVNGTSRGAARR